MADAHVSAAAVRVMESTLGAPVLERCIVAEVARAGWNDDTMPDDDSDPQP